jgi:hypothetical protein
VNLKRKRRKALMAAAAPTLAPVTHAQGFVVIGIDGNWIAFGGLTRILPTTLHVIHWFGIRAIGSAPP